MDPITAAVVGAGVLQAGGSIMGGNAQAKAYGQQADAAERNATISDMQARQAYDAGLQNELAQRRSAGQQQGEMRAAVAESGFDPGSGSALAIQQQAARDMEMDALNTRYQSLLQGYGYESQAQQDRYTAKNLRASGRAARRAGYIGAATSALTSVAGYGMASKAAGASSLTNYGVSTGGSGLGLNVGSVSSYWG